MGRAEAVLPPLTWRILRDPPASAAWNMAVDEALARSRAEGEATLRIYRWARPTLSLGRHQPARGRFDLHAIEALGVEVVRRPTGGREVLHDRELTYAVVAPLAGPGSLRGIYRAVNQALLQALEALGVDGRLAQPGHPVPPPDAGACFAIPAPGEVVARGRKLVGSAQVRMGRTVLQHGSLLLAPSTVSLAALEESPESRAPAPSSGPVPGITLQELLGRPLGFQEVASTVEAAMAGGFGGNWTRANGLTPEEDAAARSLRPRYQSAEWNWAR